MLADLGRIVVESNKRIAEVYAGLGREATAYSALPPRPPLCFMHIPKTGGASAIEWFSSMFAEAEIAPCRNATDFDKLHGLAHSYRLFAGHIQGCQAALIPPDARWISVFRDPVEMAVSTYHHRRLAPPNDWERDRQAFAARGDVLRGDDAAEKAAAEKLTQIFQDMDLLSALKLHGLSLRGHFYHPLVRRLAATPVDENALHSLKGSDESCANLVSALAARANGFLSTLRIIGEHRALDVFLRMVAVDRGWPAPPPLPRIHDFGAPTISDAADAALREAFGSYSPMDIEVYQRARLEAEKLPHRLAAECGGVEPHHVNQHHRDRFFDECPRVIAFDVHASEAWNGAGWSIRHHDGLRNSFRNIADGKSAETLAKLDPSIAEYRLFVHIWDASSQEVIDGLAASANGTPLERFKAVWREGALIAEWRVPHSVVASSRGNIRFDFAKAPETREHLMSIARIGCVPALADARG